MSGEADWVPVALSASIEPGTSAGAVVEGRELVVWRDSAGKAHVWEDRCPHRGMRMSFGFVRGDHIACLYHGWSYDAAGQCRHIPAHPDLDVPKTIRITTYDAGEACGVIWTRLAGAGETGHPLPDFGNTLPVRSLYADCSLAHALAVLKQTYLPGGKGKTVVGQLQAVAPHVWTLEGDALRLSIAIQVIGPQNVGLHILVNEGSKETVADVAQWAVALRLTLEAPVVLAEVM
ncbi:Rieske 2Fe-2S domain-containing protein [Rhizobium sp. SGZ-381]|uniref:Rieske 2Fe-2S domain-containing protein n=1 Tax=Rhizobium sp. SGZ-381 TaxID=3342800 RepID=UPI003672E3E6